MHSELPWQMETDNVVTLDRNRLTFFYTHGDLYCEDHHIFRLSLLSEKSRLALGVNYYLSNCFTLSLFSMVIAWPRSRKELHDPHRTLWVEFTRGHGTALSWPLKQASSSFQGPFGSGYFVSVILTTSLMIILCPTSHHQLFDFCHLLVSPSTGFYKLSFPVLTFHSLKICLGFTIPIFRPSNVNVFGWGIIPSSHIILGTIKLSMEAKLREELSL